MNPKKILKVFKQYQSFLIITHVNPDPDGLASQLVLARYLKDLGKKVTIVNADKVPERFLFLPGARTIKTLREIKRRSFDAAVIVDCGDFNRIGPCKQLVKPDTVLINIDHHITNDLFGNLNMVVSAASSTAEVLFDLLRCGKFFLTREMAILLYVGIMTDTGSFRYDNTTPHTYEVVCQLMRFNFSVNELYKKLYENISLNDLKYFTEVVNTFDSLYNGRVLCLELRKKVLKKFSGKFDLRDKIFSFLRSIGGVEVLVILTEHEKNKTRVNFRSQGRVNVSQLASHFNGGGHSKASGCLLEYNVNEARKKILAQVRKVL